jgi:hypothetical protein
MDQKLFGQHDGRWIPAGRPGAGNITIFNNGFQRPDGNISELDEIIPPLDANGDYVLEGGKAFGPDSAVWKLRKAGGERFTALIISGWTRQANGNALACYGDMGKFAEFTMDGDIVWKYMNPVSSDKIIPQGQQPINTPVFKINRYDVDHPAFAGKDMQPKGTIESYATDVAAFTEIQGLSVIYAPGSSTATLTSAFTTDVRLDAYDVLGRWLGTVFDGMVDADSRTVAVPQGTIAVRAVCAQCRSLR